MLADLRGLAERLLAFESTPGNEAPAQRFVADTLADHGFEVYEWTADPDRLAAHPSFPDDPDEIDCADRPSVGGVYEFSRDGPTLVLNGHVDVVPASDANGSGDAPAQQRRTPGEGSWRTDPFEPTWSDDGERLTARGAADMKAGLAACLAAAHRVVADADGHGGADSDGHGGADSDGDDEHDGALAGRVVVESVAGEEEGGIGAAAAALDNPYPFDRDAAIIAEPTELRPVVACEGSLMGRIHLRGRSAHAATRWHGESVLPHFERVRRALADLERDRGDRVTHPLYDRFDIPWPIVVGTVRAGEWASTVPSALTAEVRIGVAPGETVDDVERAVRDRLVHLDRLDRLDHVASDTAGSDDDWLADHPPTFERFGVQFEPSEIAPDEPVVGAVQAAMRAHGLDATDPLGETYGADARHYIAAGVPTVLFGPGEIRQAHFPNETVEWRQVEQATAVIADAARTYLST